MTFRLYRFFNLYRKEFWKNCLILGSVFCLIPLLTLLLLDAFHWAWVLSVIGLNVIGFLSILLGYPGKAELHDGVLTYTENYEISKGERRRLHFRISEIRQVEYLQSDFEKKRNVGRIRFRGTAEIEPSSALKDRKIVFFQLCGISNFDEYKGVPSSVSIDGPISIISCNLIPLRSLLIEC